MKKYELMFIINPTILEEGREAVITKVNNILTVAGATILKSEKWGERKLAYPIDKKKTGFYVLTTLEMDGTKLTEVESKLNITEEVMRYIVVKND
ncbi:MULTISPECIES: 30S ribosomal protein S6 [Cetobacterium]|jgi:small subunit ribosomal protein S6|uniref:Small ribosomal subunit protein bS6 n=1 Tax=Candidatus Cetobacterium colombiensis TaxID=3073100 RepID=A0ABU4WDF0_9FUSO|nr:30S ribosomal protein S6 [Candidatus Cetobacterium colombiensis]MDX8336430.1 30S ribosomal protein S6 [Candidatus Cetobacterium colombiensis]